VLVSLLVALPLAHADKTGRKIKAKVTEAMENYDLMEFEVAKNMLIDALEMAESAEYQGPEVAQAFLDLGIVFFSGLEDKQSAREAFEAAVEVDSGIEIDVAYKTAEITEMLEEIKASAKGSTSSDAPAEESCDELEGISHELIEKASRGQAREVKVRVGEDLDADGVVLYYRAQGKLDFNKVKLAKKGECAFEGVIPGAAVKGELLHYYIAAIDSDGESIETKGTSGSPNIIEVADSDSEDPLFTDKDLDDEDEDDLAAGDAPSIFLSIGLGTGTGYINGPTEKTGSPVEPGLAAAYFHLFPELGYYVSRQFSISAAFRMGFPIGANVEGHATFAPAGMARFRYTLSESGQGLELSAAVGAGIIRNVVPIQNAPDPMQDTDTTAMGPLLLGGGLGYNMSLGGPMRLVLEANALAGVPAFGTDDSCMPGDGCVNPKFGVEMDFNLAVLFAF
jgi:hypothetical protein